MRMDDVPWLLPPIASIDPWGKVKYGWYPEPRDSGGIASEQELADWAWRKAFWESADMYGGGIVNEDERDEAPLVEAIKKRIHEVLRRSVADRNDLVKDNAIDGEHAWNTVARECLRQMEWARSNCVESVDSFDAGNSWLVNKPLTPAPDDWKP